MSEPSIAAARGILADADRQLRRLETQLIEVEKANDRSVAEQAGHAARSNGTGLRLLKPMPSTRPRLPRTRMKSPALGLRMRSIGGRT